MAKLDPGLKLRLRTPGFPSLSSLATVVFNKRQRALIYEANTSQAFVNGKETSWLTVFCLLVAVALAIFFTPVGAVVRMMFESKPETVVKSGQPIVQAISDFRSEHGLLPETLTDLVPGCLPSVPGTEWTWFFDTGY